MISQQIWRILIALNVPASSAGAVTLGLENVQGYGTAAEAELEVKLTEIEALTAKLYKESSSTNFALEKADVLSYDAKLRVAGILTLLENSMTRVGGMVGVAPDFSSLAAFKRVAGLLSTKAGRLDRYR